MTLKRILTFLAVCYLAAANAFSQSEAGGSLTVRSDPEGALVQLKGHALVTGITPATFRYPFVGTYELMISKHGYENYTTHVVLEPGKHVNVEVTLTPKTRFKAAVRSLFIPGWGQKYSDQTVKGTIFLGLAVASIAGYFVADHHFNTEFDRFEAARDEFDEAFASGASYNELQQRLAVLERQQDRAYDAEDVRRIMIGTVIGVWTLNVIDAFFFTPQEHGSFTVKGITVTPGGQQGALGLTFSHRF
jgi:hypothetical protein